MGWLRFHIILSEGNIWSCAGYFKGGYGEWLPFHYPVYVKYTVRLNFMKWRNIITPCDQEKLKYLMDRTKFLQSTLNHQIFSSFSFLHLLSSFPREDNPSPIQSLHPAQTPNIFDSRPLVSHCVWTWVLLVQRPMNWNMLFDPHIPKNAVARLGQDNHSKQFHSEGRRLRAIHKSLLCSNSEICWSDIARTFTLW